MAAYNSYSKTSYGAQGGEDSGGFFAGGGTQQASQGGGGRSYKDDSLRPVTVKQVIDADEAYPGADLRIDGNPVTQITLVGQVRAINPQPTNITYKLDDGTGVLEIKVWVDIDKRDDMMEGGEQSNNPGGSNIELDQYVRVWGRIKPFNNKKHVVAHVVRPIEDFNEVNYHLLESTYVHLCLTKGQPGAKQEGGGDGMFVDGGADYNNMEGAKKGNNADRAAACSPLAQKMFNYILNAPGGNEGVHLNVIASGTGVTVSDVLKAADELTGHCLIYATIDDETWAILEEY